MDDDKKIRICRVCISGIEESEKCFSVFKKYDDLLVPGKEQDDILIADKITSIAQVDIRDGDGLPTTVCSSCLLELEDAYNFKRKCENSDNFLRSSSNTDTEQINFTLKEESYEIQLDSFNADILPELHNEQNDDNISLAGSIKIDHNYSNDKVPYERDEILKTGKNGPIEFKCEHCNNTLNSKYKLRIHLRKEHDIFLCSDCNQIFDTFGALRYHRKDRNCKSAQKPNNNIKLTNELKVTPKSQIKHGTLDPYQSNKLNQTKKEDVIKETKLKPSKAIDLKLECHDCGGLFKSKCKLRVHWKKTHLFFRCTSCKMKFKSYNALKNHQKAQPRICRNSFKMRIEDVGGQLQYYCNECDYNSKRTDGMLQHLVVHSTEKKYKCSACPKTFARNNALKIHIEDAHQQVIFKQTCPICGKFNMGYHKIRYHMNKHKRKQLLQCDYCVQTFVNKQYLIHHIYKHMGNVKKYSCDVCNKLFFTKKFAAYHKKRHQNVPTFCSICGYSSLNRYKINSHEKKHNESNVACSDCGKFLENNMQLSLHKQRHAKNLCCVVCKATFFSRKGLSKHLTQVHKIYVSKGGLGKVKKKKSSLL